MSFYKQRRLNAMNNHFKNNLTGSILPNFRILTRLSNAFVGEAIGIVIFEIIGLALYPVVFSSITSANVGGKVLGSNATIVNLVPLMYALLLIVVPAIVV